MRVKRIISVFIFEDDTIDVADNDLQTSDSNQFQNLNECDARRLVNELIPHD